MPEQAPVQEAGVGDSGPIGQDAKLAARLETLAQPSLQTFHCYGSVFPPGEVEAGILHIQVLRVQDLLAAGGLAFGVARKDGHFGEVGIAEEGGELAVG